MSNRFFADALTPVFAGSAGVSGLPDAEVVDEIIAEHPAPPLAPYAPGSRLAARGPVHTALTASIRSHYPDLPAALQSVEGLSAGDCDSEEIPLPQVTYSFQLCMPAVPLPSMVCCLQCGS